MKKKVLGLILALCVIVPVSLSAEALDLSVGATAQYQNAAGSLPSSDIDDFTNIENYKFGAEAKVKVLLVEASARAILGPTTIGGVNGVALENLMTAGVSIDLLNLLRLGVGLGPEYSLFVTQDGEFKNSANTAPFDFATEFMNANCVYKANVDLLLGGLTLSASYTIPSTGFNLQNIADNNFTVESLKPVDYSNGRVSVSVLLSLI